MQVVWNGGELINIESSADPCKRLWFTSLKNTKVHAYVFHNFHCENFTIFTVKISHAAIAANLVSYEE